MFLNPQYLLLTTFLIKRMKQIVVILLLFFTLKSTTSGQSRVLKGTLTAQPNTSTTIFPHIVVSKTPETLKDDSALFNPRYVPPPPIDSSTLISTSTVKEDIRNQNAQFTIDANKGGTSLTPTLSFGKNKQPQQTPETVYQYKTPDTKPIVENDVAVNSNTPPPSFHYNPKGTVNKKPINNNHINTATVGALVTDPTDLAASNNYGNTTTVSKWQPKKQMARTSWKKSTSTDSNKGVVVQKWVNPNLKKQIPAINSVVNTVPQNYNGVNNSSTTLTPSIRTKTQPIPSEQNNNSLTPNVNTNNNSSQSQEQQNTSGIRPDYKINLGVDGKFTVTFFNNGGSVIITQFGRIASVSMPTSGGNVTPQYNYRGLLESVGNLPIQYTYEGRVQSVGNSNIGYNYNGNIQSIGNTQIVYNYNGTIDKIGNTKVNYDANGNVSGTSGANPVIAMKQ